MSKRPMLANPEGRSTPEWIGKTADTPVPDHVKFRVLLRQNRRCKITGRLIRPGQYFETDHIKELALGGENRESNLQAVFVDGHKAKTAEAVARKAKADAAGKRAHGITRPKQQIQSPGFARVAKNPGRVKIDKSALPPLGLSEIGRRYGSAS